MQSGTLELDQLVKIFIFFYQMLWLIMVILRLDINQIKFSPVWHKRYFFMSISILSLSTFTRNPVVVYAIRNICGKYFFCTVTNISIYIMENYELEVTFSQTLERYSWVHSELSTQIINQAQFVITTWALKCSRHCMLLSKTFAVNAFGMLAIPSQNPKHKQN